MQRKKPEPRVTKRCTFCEKEFTHPPNQTRRRTCSVECQARLRCVEGRTLMECPVCGKLYTEVRSHADRRKTCSMECSAAFKSVEKEKKICPVCGEVFFPVPSKAKKRKYCSLVCYHRSLQREKRPDAKQLEHLLQTISLSSVAKLYGMYPSSIRNWCRHLGVHIPGRKERLEITRRNKRSGSSGSRLFQKTINEEDFGKRKRREEEEERRGK